MLSKRAREEPPSMERYQIPPPAKFDVSKPEEWPKWKKRFERYRIASGLDVQPGENQVNALLYTMGEDAEDVVTSLQLTDEALTEYETVLERLQFQNLTMRFVSVWT